MANQSGTVHRGMITTSTGEEVVRAPAPEKAPRKATAKREQAPDPLTGLARFLVTTNARGYNLVVAANDRKDDERMTELVAAASAAMKRQNLRVLPFRGGRVDKETGKMRERARFDTKDPDLIAYLRHGIATGRLKRITEELSMRDVTCPTCGEVVKASAMGAHLLAHQEMDSVPAGVRHA